MSFGNVVFNFVTFDDATAYKNDSLTGEYSATNSTFSGGVLNFDVEADVTFSIASYSIAKSTTMTSGNNLGTPTIVLNSATGTVANFSVYMVSSTGVLNGTFKQFSAVLNVQE